MKRSDKIRLKIEEACNKISALYSAAEGENRACTEDEKSQLATLASELEGLRADLKLAITHEESQALLAQRQIVPALREDAEIIPLEKIVVPAGMRRTKALRGFASDREAYAAGQFFLAAIYGSQSSREWCEKHGIELRGALSTTDPAKGGFLVPSFLDQAIINLRESRGVFRQNARVLTMASDTHSIARRTGGYTAYFVGENDETTASDKTNDQVKLVAHKLAVLAKYSSEISEDAIIDVASDIAQEIAYAFADKEDSCGFNGDGTSTYGGMVGVKNAVAAGSEYTAATGNTAFGTLDLADFEGMVGKLPTYALQNAKWFISRAGWAASMLRLANAAGGNTSREIEGGVQPMFMGFPVVWAQVMNSTLTAQTSTEGLAYFGDLSQAATLGDRRQTSIRASDQRYFELDQIGILGTQRFDINVHERGTASAAGSIISLLTPGS